MNLFKSTKSNESQNVLFQKALKEVERIEKDFQQMSTKGKCEALIFVSIFIYTEACRSEKYKNSILIDEFLDEIALYVKNFMFFKSEKFVTNFVNDRFKFYLNEYNTNREYKMYTPMFIYNAIYLKPFIKSPQVMKSCNINPSILFEFKSIIFKLVSQIKLV
jgi:hypothetical protein